MFIIKLLIILMALSVIIFMFILETSARLENKPRSNKFRQWWSKHVVDLDGKYND